MRDRKRIAQVCVVLYGAWRENPDLRLGQLLIGLVGEDVTLEQIFYMEDEQWLELLKKHYPPA